MERVIKLPTIQRHPLRDAWMVFAPQQVNPFNIPFIGTLRECKKALAHLEKKLIEHGYNIIK